MVYNHSFIVTFLSALASDLQSDNEKHD